VTTNGFSPPLIERRRLRSGSEWILMDSGTHRVHSCREIGFQPLNSAASADPFSEDQTAPSAAFANDRYAEGQTPLQKNEWSAHIDQTTYFGKAAGCAVLDAGLARTVLGEITFKLLREYGLGPAPKNYCYVLESPSSAPSIWRNLIRRNATIFATIGKP
jgi:hypothetical protein